VADAAADADVIVSKPTADEVVTPLGDRSPASAEPTVETTQAAVVGSEEERKLVGKEESRVVEDTVEETPADVGEVVDLAENVHVKSIAAEDVDPFMDASFPAEFPSKFPGGDASAFAADFPDEDTIVFSSATDAFADAAVPEPDPFAAADEDPFPAEKEENVEDASLAAEEFPSADANVPFPSEDVAAGDFDTGFDAASFTDGAAWSETPTIATKSGDGDKKKKKKKDKKREEKKGSVVISRAQRAKQAKKAGKTQAKETGSSFVDAMVAGVAPKAKNDFYLDSDDQNEEDDDDM
jgi:hypothetical protein